MYSQNVEVYIGILGLVFQALCGSLQEAVGQDSLVCCQQCFNMKSLV